jgi:hypothetical protein
VHDGAVQVPQVLQVMRVPTVPQVLQVLQVPVAEAGQLFAQTTCVRAVPTG